MALMQGGSIGSLLPKAVMVDYTEEVIWEINHKGCMGILLWKREKYSSRKVGIY